MKYTAIGFATAGMVALTSAHGFIISPKARLAGPAMEAACGGQVYSNQASDNYGNVQGELQVAATQTDYNAAACDIWLCKGYKFADNTANVQKYTAGQVVPMTVDIRAPHTGYANVSVVKTSTNTMIGGILKNWDVYASTAVTIPADEKQFSIAMPDVSSECAVAGDCVIQWYWNAPSIDQTYEACIDFTMGGSGGAAPVASTSSSAVSVVATVKSATSASAVSPVVKSSSAVPTMVASKSATSAPAVSPVASSGSAIPTVVAPKSTMIAPAPYPSSSKASTAAAPSKATSAPVVSPVLSSSSAAPTATMSKPVKSAPVPPTATASSAAPIVSSSKPASSVPVAPPTAGSSSAATTGVTSKKPSSAPIVSPIATSTAAKSPASPPASRTKACTSKITIHSSATAKPSAAPSSKAVVSAVTSAPSVSLAPVYSSALGNLTSAIPTSALTSIVPSGSVNPIISSYIANLTSILPTGASATGAVPTSLPTAYSWNGTRQSAPVEPHKGMSLKEIFEWIAYLLSSAFSTDDTKGHEQRSHARDLGLHY